MKRHSFLLPKILILLLSFTICLDTERTEGNEEKERKDCFELFNIFI